MSMKEQIETLERQLVAKDKKFMKIVAANDKHHAKEIETIRDVNEDLMQGLRDDRNDITRAKNKLVEQKTSLERTVSALSHEVSNHENNLKDIQRDIRTACELMYGHDFDPSNIERLMPMMSAGVEYVPKAQVENVSPYVEPAQRLIRMIWRRTFWGLNPLMDRAYGESPK